MKRIMDITLAILAVIVAAPIMAVIALGVRLDSPGRAIFSQPRLGKNGRIFFMHKFRKFPNSWGDDGPGVTVAGDARMTRLGRFLERFKLDELPQLWNILCGEMSFVGPRPESVRYADLFEGEYARVLDFVPGIFGPNQVAFRNESEMYPVETEPETFYREELFPQKARVDIAYFSQSNLVTDFAWIVRGFFVTITGAVNFQRSVDLYGIVLVMDMLIIEISWLLANLIRFGGIPPSYHLDVYMAGTWVLPIVLFVFIISGGCYRAPVRYFCFGDAIRLSVSNIVGWSIGYFILLSFFHRATSLYVLPLALLLSSSLMITPRICRRELWWRRAREKLGHQNIGVALYGAGTRGGSLASLLNEGFPCANVVGFLDDNDSAMRGRKIMGHKILGSERDLNTVHTVYNIDQLWVTFEPDVYKYQRLRSWCEENNVKLVVLPLAQPFLSLSHPENEEGAIRASKTDLAEALT